MKFTKMEGAGNDYVYVDLFHGTLPEPPETLSGKVADRHFGIGGDGLVLITPSEKADARMRMFNPDGSESEMCGNAVRCVAKYVHDHGICRRIPLTVETGKGVLTLYPEVSDGLVTRVRVDMGEAILIPAKVPTLLRAPSGREEDPVAGVPFDAAGRDFAVTCVSMGNPHCVVQVEDVAGFDVEGIGKLFEHNPAFPEGVNTEFIHVEDRGNVTMRVWERGSGETWACGTGACAAAVSCILNGLTENALTVHLRGGDLFIEWDRNRRRHFATAR